MTTTADTSTPTWERLRGKPPFALPVLIGERAVWGDASLQIRYPYTGAVIGTVPALTRADVVGALEAARDTTFELSRHERSRVLFAIAERLEKDAEPFARLISWESGLSLKDTTYEVRRAQDVFRFSAMEALRDEGQVFACDTSANGKRRRGYTVREPLRLVSAITPFNHPLNQVAHKVAPSIATNNTMVLKPSSRTPLSALALALLMREAGLPDGMITMVTGAAEEIGPILWTHPDVELVSLTGGTEIGKRIAREMGFKRAILELGGNDPLIVLRDADLDEAARLAVYGAFKNSGQRCTAVKRIIVEEPVADAFVARLVEATARLVVGDPMDPRTDIGTVIGEDDAVEFERRLRSAVAAGAVVQYGGGRAGAQITPTVVDHVRQEMELVSCETFGPYAPVIRVPDLDAAIAVANGTEFGLSSGVVTNDLRAINRCIRELRCGTINVREVPGYRTELTPFGGTKDSGLGVKEGVLEAMRAMTFTKLYTLPTAD
ncbi:MAG TPA: aldehyde dehydrogenase family protein [Candidatus Limnocylindria bacterium]|nr:aldehyde dehydrogenase family protein [Candidatus Limnocylindria bacterium]